MKEHPILYSTEMVKAILAGKKTQTRRVMNPQPLQADINAVPTNGWNSVIPMNPYGMPGDMLWVREQFVAWSLMWKLGQQKGFYYRANFPSDYKASWKWKPSIHMPKAAARIWLQITDIRIERLQEISEEDAIDEGVNLADSTKWFKHTHVFQELWEKINGPESWNANPYVWVIQFKVLSTTGKPTTNNHHLTTNIKKHCHEQV